MRSVFLGQFPALLVTLVEVAMTIWREGEALKQVWMWDTLAFSIFRRTLCWLVFSTKILNLHFSGFYRKFYLWFDKKNNNNYFIDLSSHVPQSPDLREQSYGITFPYSSNMLSLTPSTPPKKKKLYSEGVKMEIPENHIGTMPNFFELQWFHSHGAWSREGVKNYMPALAFA